MDIDIRREHFNRTTKRRIKTILKNLDTLSNCSNRRYYDYSNLEILRLYFEIKKRMAISFRKFSYPYSKSNTEKYFDFNDNLLPSKLNRAIIEESQRFDIILSPFHLNLLVDEIKKDKELIRILLRQE